MPPVLARAFLGLDDNLVESPTAGFALLSFANSDSGLDAAVFHDKASGQNYLSLRGTAGPIDLAEDAKLSIVGFANDQAISLYRYYRELTTPAGQSVQYSAEERSLLHALNIQAPANLPFVGAILDNRLDAALDGDVGLGVLSPSERLIVTGHSLGGHLALLFGRLFPQATDQIFTYNAPGIASWGNLILTSAGVAPNDPSRVTNVVSANGMDFTAAFGSRPGTTYRVFNEPGNPIQNHSIVGLADSLALYEVIGKLSPGLSDRIDDVSAILAAASAKPAESLEATLDALRHRLMGDTGATLIATEAADQTQRDDYYSRLYGLRDAKADGTDWGISSLAGLSAGALESGAQSDMALRQALRDLAPFEVVAAPTDADLPNASEEWISARSGFLSQLLESRTADRGYALAATNQNTRFVDAAQDVSLSAITPSADIIARSFSGSESALQGYLSGLSYGTEYFFGKEDAIQGDVVDGTAAGDELFGGAGDDILRAAAGDDVLEGDQGADTMEGGDGYDIYVADASDTIRDADGSGEVELGQSILQGGQRRSDGLYASADGTHVYDFSAGLEARGTLIVDGGLRIEDFANGDLGIDLSGTPRPGDPGSTDFTFFGDLNGLGVADGLARDDSFAGRPGDTRFETGGGMDWVADNAGGNDVLLLGAGEDFGYGGAGADWIEGGPGNDFIVGGAGDDVLFAQSSADDIDIAIANQGFHTFRKEFLSGGDGDDTLFGSGASDYLEGDGGSDTIYAGAGDDVITGDDLRLSYESGQSPDPNMNHPLVTERSLLDDNFYFGPFSNIDFTYDASVGAVNDVIHAGAGNDAVHGDGGDDTIYGDAGDDTLFGDVGDDVIHGGDGNDLVDGGSGNDALYGGAGDDVLTGGDGQDVFYGGTGADTYSVGAGDLLAAERGDAVSVVSDTGPVGTTIVFGPDIAPDEISLTDDGTRWTANFRDGSISFQSALSDWTGIHARFADGTEWSQADFLQRAPSPSPPGTNDVFVGTPAPEHFAGGGGDDVYVLAAGGGEDTIEDTAGTDGLGFLDVASADVDVSRSGNDYLINYPGGVVRLVNQADAPSGIDAVAFLADGVLWSRADLDAHAGPAPTPPPPSVDELPLGVQSAHVGQPFAYSLAPDAFAQEHAHGTPSFDVAGFEGDVPAWLSVDHQTGALSGTPAAGDAGVSAVLVAMKDDDKVLAVRPLAIVVDAGDGATPADSDTESSSQPAGSSDTGQSSQVAAAPESTANGTPGSDQSAQTSQLAAPEPQPATPAAASSQSAESSTLAAENSFERAFAPAPAVGAIQDAVYSQIGSLLSSPALFHASSFMERYAEAIEKFQERSQPTQQDAPPPTEEEIGAYNAAVHAWLDEDLQRRGASDVAERHDYDGTDPRYAESAGALERLLGLGHDAFQQPGLPIKSLQPRPGLQEGLTQIRS
ncbi:MAG TPA: putative Ig domain-containing protein [Burkholderiales bacterium]|nr:putative Ig domain-containing protein [Burkholderiales bacterium]